MAEFTSKIRTIQWVDNVSRMVDQTKFPEKFEYIDPAGTSYKNGSENPYGYMNLHSSWFSSNTQDKGAQFIVAGSVYCDGYIGGTGTIKGSEDGVGKITINNDKATMKEVTYLKYKEIELLTETGMPSKTSSRNVLPLIFITERSMKMSPEIRTSINA